MKCVYCTNTTNSNNGVRRSLYRLPIKKPKELQLWLKNLSLQKKQPLDHLRLCSDHFSEDCFVKENETIKLRERSIPTLIFIPQHQKKCIYCNVSKTNDCGRTFPKFPLQNSVQL